MKEYDMILAGIEEKKEMKVNSHKCLLKRHPLGHHNGWNCDHIKGLNRCLSGMTDFYQANSTSPPIYGWRCSSCDFDMCSRCLKADIFIQEVLLNRED